MGYVDYAVLYQQGAPDTDEVPDFLFDMCVPQVDLHSRGDFEDFKTDLGYGEYSDEWKWYRSLGKRTRNALKLMVDHKLPVELRYIERVKAARDWQLAGEFLLELMMVIREVGLVDSLPYRVEGKLIFVQEVDLS